MRAASAGLRLALAQSPGELSGQAARLDWLARTLADMAPCDLLLLPECFTCGYNLPDRLAALAEPPDGESRQAVARLAAQHGTAILYGYAERGADGAVYNAAQCIAPDGRTLHQFRKLALAPGFEAEVYAPGQGAATFTYCGIVIGVLICYDVEFPETVRHLARKGAQLIAVPTALGADWPWVADTLAPARAYENGVYVAYANHCGTENGHRYYGHSVIAEPYGQVAARAGGAPQVLYGDIDPGKVRHAQAELPYFRDSQRIAL